VAEPAYTRLDVDERRRQLLDAGTRLFTEHPYEELTMSRIAAEIGISKGLLYHYFPSKADYFRATLEQAAGELARATAPDPSLPAAEQLLHAVDAYLCWIDDHSDSYVKLLRSANALSEVSSLIDRVRDETAERIVASLTPRRRKPRPALRTAVHAWLWSIDGACLDWLERRDLSRDQLRDLLVRGFLASLDAARAVDPRVEVEL
jgi:AcrR family transcriptional regulator